MSKVLTLLVLLAVLSLAACLPGGAPSAPAAVSEKQQVINFLKSAAPVEKEVATIDNEMADFSTNFSKLSKDVRDARLNDFANRIKAAKTKAVAIQKPAFPEAAAFYDKWLAATTNFELHVTSLAKGDIATAEKALTDLTPSYNASDAALAALLAKYSIAKTEVGWPT